MPDIQGRKVIVTRDEVAAFNRAWPCSKLRDRSYWFEFDMSGDLVDTDLPESDDGHEASAMAADCYQLLWDTTYADWMNQ